MEEKNKLGRPKKYDEPSTTAQNEANKAWQEKNRERARYLRNRSTARSFAKKQATSEDLNELQNLINERRKQINTLDS
ncbi:hypothetical protein H9L19_06425 [Weissella diestrammenae]|uniref:Uncharacterized protein n=1 Tax=Weissella diestrammenae TaxID=1162633 RepID=A0A7G9T4J2_9LACO|nr:hypothetical protein [Weissella diestrammenae]MCM0582042.1 hypothetical protein [Weissella diestrammenae]QNN75017.1 hypothetical protein H9L19_06425 [Weissella diestrammenae]